MAHKLASKLENVSLCQSSISKFSVISIGPGRKLLKNVGSQAYWRIVQSGSYEINLFTEHVSITDRRYLAWSLGCACNLTLGRTLSERIDYGMHKLR